jgi:hypothetical protein
VSAGSEERHEPPAGAIRLAAFAVDPFGSGATVRARFAVPEVASGSYEVLICDDPCTIPGFGGYVQGWLTVMQTPAEARLFALARKKSGMARTLEDRTRHLKREVRILEAELDGANEELRVRASDLRAEGLRIAALQMELGWLRAASSREAPAPPGVLGSRPRPGGRDCLARRAARGRRGPPPPDP